MTGSNDHPRYDVVVFGATSFVGRILCRYLLETYGFGRDLKWALAGRSRQKLQTVRANLGDSAGSLDVIAVDATDEASLRRMCDRTNVVASTVGPYALYGEPLVKVCAESGTDYCDLTGEVPWMQRMIARYASTAQSSGARIIHCCGFDSIPSDLGVWFLQQQAQASFGKMCSRVKLRVKAARGGVSGGTIASLMNVLKESDTDPEIRRQLANPYSLCGESPRQGLKQPSGNAIEFDPDFSSWTAPFIMSGINTRIVHRTNMLLDYPYGSGFIYDESVLAGKGVRGWLGAIAAKLGFGVLMFGPVRRLLTRFVLPKPGQGPSPQQQEQGFFDIRLFGRTDTGQTLRVRVAGDRDPGYGSTAKMLGEAAVCLARDVSKTECTGGFWTPASAFGDKLVPRLCLSAGANIERVDSVRGVSI
ncbi:MAG: saccharopine dehydrogenase NADP-binding domain-containing protein [Planctomycetes bacterium]|nr:saccharopine dehydrogenase NADP-binding domain-containing protein [Planctomycetota bacterium]